MKLLYDYKFSSYELKKMKKQERAEQKALYTLLFYKQVGQLASGRLIVRIGDNVYSIILTNKKLIARISYFGSFEYAKEQGLLFTPMRIKQ